MGELQEKVETLLKTRFPDAEMELEVVPASEKISGFLVWDGFAGETHRDRQRRLWNTFRQALNVDEQQHISAVLTVTPAEMAALRDEDA